MEDLFQYKLYESSILYRQFKLKKMKETQQILVSVGTTKFDELIKVADGQDFIRFMSQHGFNRMIYQIGLTGQYVPTHGDHFRSSPDINKYFEHADLIICHGGAGTLLQNLLNKKMIISVANDSLMNNHQIEIIEKLDSEGYLLGFASVQQLKKGYDKISNFLKKKECRKFERTQKCIFNELVFDS